MSRFRERQLSAPTKGKRRDGRYRNPGRLPTQGQPVRFGRRRQEERRCAGKRPGVFEASETGSPCQPAVPRARFAAGALAAGPVPAQRAPWEDRASLKGECYL